MVILDADNTDGFLLSDNQILRADAGFASKIHILTASEENASNLSVPKIRPLVYKRSSSFTVKNG
jgi:hypothetical protein